MNRPSASSHSRLLVAAAAAFCTYFCMYAFRKPFTSATYEGEQLFGLGLGTVLILAQLAGYMLSKFIGIKVISEMRREYRAATIIGLIVVAELALVGFAFVPAQLKPLMMFINGLPLGMVFGLVLGFLEGRRQTELLTAILCASFISSSGVVKSVGQWLMTDFGVDEYLMPMLTGLLFFGPLLFSVWVLQLTPPPDAADRLQRSQRKEMNAGQRRLFVQAYWPGLTLLVLVYMATTVIRTIRDDFGVGIWQDLGEAKKPAVFAQTEIIVALCVIALNASASWIKHNRTALRVTVGMMCLSFVAVAGAMLLVADGRISPFAFMIACGVGLYVPYVAFHTTVFERLIAASKRPCNLGFLMYLADAMGYLGYGVVIFVKELHSTSSEVLPFFIGTSLAVASGSIVALLLVIAYFERVLPGEKTIPAVLAEPATPLGATTGLSSSASWRRSASMPRQESPRSKQGVR